jgi:predicted phage-related endonuclease
MSPKKVVLKWSERRSFIGGSDASIIMGQYSAACNAATGERDFAVQS